MKGSDHKSKFLLTNREREVFELLVQDKTTRDIAQLLFISEKTVRNHISNVMCINRTTKISAKLLGDFYSIFEFKVCVALISPCYICIIEKNQIQDIIQAAYMAAFFVTPRLPKSSSMHDHHQAGESYR